jgi:hypothetical protein
MTVEVQRRKLHPFFMRIAAAGNISPHIRS